MLDSVVDQSPRLAARLPGLVEVVEEVTPQRRKVLQHFVDDLPLSRQLVRADGLYGHDEVVGPDQDFNELARVLRASFAKQHVNAIWDVVPEPLKRRTVHVQKEAEELRKVLRAETDVFTTIRQLGKEKILGELRPSARVVDVAAAIQQGFDAVTPDATAQHSFQHAPVFPVVGKVHQLRFLLQKEQGPVGNLSKVFWPAVLFSGGPQVRKVDGGWRRVHAVRCRL